MLADTAFIRPMVISSRCGSAFDGLRCVSESCGLGAPRVGGLLRRVRDFLTAKPVAPAYVQTFRDALRSRIAGKATGVPFHWLRWFDAGISSPETKSDREVAPREMVSYYRGAQH